MILYKPREMQRYVYYGTDQTEVYWVHFTGNNVKNILREYHLFESGQIIQTGNSTEYHQIFRKMIQELQLTRPHYEEYLSLLLRELFLLISRQLLWASLPRTGYCKKKWKKLHSILMNILQKKYRLSSTPWTNTSVSAGLSEALNVTIA